MERKTIGILGGMGPEATAHFFLRLTQKTPVHRDQDHPRVIVDSNPGIPDRTQAILHGGASPVEALVATGENLHRAGARIACIPCFTAHYYFDEVAARLPLPLVNIFEVLERHLDATFPQDAVIGILATTGTLRSGLFPRYLSDRILLYPEEAVQEAVVMEAIYHETDGVKAGGDPAKARRLFRAGADHLFLRGADVVIYGCTEIGLVMAGETLEKPGIDPMELLIDALLDAAAERP